MHVMITLIITLRSVGVGYMPSHDIFKIHLKQNVPSIAHRPTAGMNIYLEIKGRKQNGKG